eukprot:1160012-Pelagomonas_calceolata.AAC.7
MHANIQATKLLLTSGVERDAHRKTGPSKQLVTSVLPAMWFSHLATSSFLGLPLLCKPPGAVHFVSKKAKCSTRSRQDDDAWPKGPSISGNCAGCSSVALTTYEHK